MKNNFRHLKKFSLLAVVIIVILGVGHLDLKNIPNQFTEALTLKWKKTKKSPAKTTPALKFKWTWPKTEESKDKSNLGTGPAGYSQIFEEAPCISKPGQHFGRALIDPENVSRIIPAGSAAGEEIKPHSYVRVQGDKAALYAPADSELVEGAYYQEPPDFPIPTTYLLHFQVSCELAYLLDHIDEPVSKIKVAFSISPAPDTRTVRIKPISFKAGELLGYAHGTGVENIKTFDFGVYDGTHTNQFVNQNRYLQSHNFKSLHAVCPYQYFPSELNTAYRQKFVSEGLNRPVPGGECRVPDQDKAGTIAGAWFKRENSSSVEPHVGIGLAYDKRGTMVVGLDSGYFFTDDSDPSFLDPNAVTTEHCYHNTRGQILYFRLSGPMKLQVYEGTGICPASFPAERAHWLYR